MSATYYHVIEGEPTFVDKVGNLLMDASEDDTIYFHRKFPGVTRPHTDNVVCWCDMVEVKVSEVDGMDLGDLEDRVERRGRWASPIL